MAKSGNDKVFASEQNQWLKALEANEQIQTNFRKLELRLLGAQSLEDWFRVIFVDVPEALSLDAISLELYDPDGVIRELCFEHNIDFNVLKGVRLEDERRTLQFLYPNQSMIHTRLGKINPQQVKSLFEHIPSRVGSVALVPMMMGRCLVGSINCFSYNESRFTNDLATDFLHHFAAIASHALGHMAEKGKLENLCRQDRLTKLGNKRSLEERLAQEIARAQRFGEALSVCFIDFDHFKILNDTYGHDAGDEVLRQIGSLFKNKLRGSDWAARFGGEEFVVVLPKTERYGAGLVAERLREHVSCHPFVLSAGQAIHTTISIGVADLSEVISGKAQTVRDTLLKCADERLYRAKATGRNQVVSE